MRKMVSPHSPQEKIVDSSHTDLFVYGSCLFFSHTNTNLQMNTFASHFPKTFVSLNRQASFTSKSLRKKMTYAPQLLIHMK